MKTESRVLADSVNPIKSINLIVTMAYGRAGSIFIQSLFDGHKSIITLPYFGAMYSSIPPYVDDLDREIDTFIEKYRAIFDTSRGYFGDVGGFVAGKFGPKGDEDLRVDSGEFKSKFIDLMNKYGVDPENGRFSRKSFFICVHIAYNKCVKDFDTGDVKYIFHNPHKHDELQILLDDFRNLYFVAMTRDPRQDWASWKKIHAVKMGRKVENVPAICLFLSLYKYSKASYGVSNFIDQLDRDHVRFIDLENLHILNKVAILRFCDWLQIEFEECLLSSTFNGQQWFGNAANLKASQSFNKDMVRDAWRRELPRSDRDIIELLLNGSIEYFGYSTEGEIANSKIVFDRFRYRNWISLFFHCFLYGFGSPRIVLSKQKKVFSNIKEFVWLGRKMMSPIAALLPAFGLFRQLAREELDRRLQEISIEQRHLSSRERPMHLYIDR